MALKIYLIGARAAGKSSVFDALAQTPEGRHFATKGPHRLGTVKVPDERLEILNGMFNPRKLVPAEVTFVDIALAGGDEVGRFGSFNAFLSEADAFALVVQAHGEMDGAGQLLNPVAQLESVLLDLVLADLEKIERRVEKIQQEVNRGMKQSLPELEVLLKCKAAIDEGQSVREVPLSAEEAKRINSFAFLSQKRLLVVANTGENDPQGEGCAELRAECAARGFEFMAFCAPLEAEIAALAEKDQAAFLRDYGLAEPVRTRLIQAAYRTLKLISFFTVGDDEVRAWTIVQGTDAMTAAGKIHTDFARAFIRAETVGAATLIEKQSLAACREAGLLRLEGKGYVVQDGDVIEIRAGV
ncbi:MAG: redox-regulated ATPase YchF [Lentisphaerae bacterium]|jgi:GTP-binding protein YchF|nr:redox-regulated ATPase YchF [Lentisphaerota bacterium]